MSENQQKVYELKIVLKDVKPIIWRQIQVSENYTFGHLSDSIISSMGWYGSHMHQFHVRDSVTGKREIIGEKPDSHEFCTSTKWENEAEIRNYFVDNKKKALYIYDMGDGWIHEINLVRIIVADPGVNYPRCVDGKGVCPPEDCGGPSGFMKLLALRKKKTLTDDEREELENYDMDGCNYDPDSFDPKKVFFITSDTFKDCCIT